MCQKMGYLFSKIKSNNLTKNDGLSNIILDLDAKDENHLWLATSNGLSKFDGEKFVNFQDSGLPSIVHLFM